MIVKAKHARASRVSRQKATSALSSHAKYLQYRERDPEHETRADRQFFNDEYDTIDRRWVVKDVMNEQEQAGDICYHRIILSPSQEEPVNDWREWTREVMRDLEDRFDQELNWYAVHHANTDDPHVHVILQGTGTNRKTGCYEPVTFTAEDFHRMRESGREHSDYEHQHFLAEKWREFDELKAILPKSPSHEARRKAATFLDYMSQNERLVGSIMTDIVGRFQLFDSDDVRTATATNDLDFEQMAETPTALYLSIPYTEVDLYTPLLACLTTQMFRAWSERAKRERTRSLPRGIACYMDEFANLGYIPGYPRFVSIARYLRVSLLMVTQDFDQLDTLYGKSAASTIQANAKTHLLLPGAGERECEFYSRRIGETTAQTWTRTRRGTSWFGTDDTWTQGEARRRLFNPDELRTMQPRSMLVLRADLGPMIVKTTPYYKDRSVAHMANLPYPVAPMHQGPLAPVSGPAPQTPKPAAPVIDADQDDSMQQINQASGSDIRQHFLDEEE